MYSLSLKMCNQFQFHINIRSWHIHKLVSPSFLLITLKIRVVRFTSAEFFKILRTLTLKLLYSCDKSSVLKPIMPQLSLGREFIFPLYYVKCSSYILYHVVVILYDLFWKDWWGLWWATCKGVFILDWCKP